VTRSVIVSAARTAVGRFGGVTAEVPAVSFGSRAIAGALERADLAGDNVDYVIMGQVLQAGTGQATARQAALAAGIPVGVPALTVNKVCLSSLNAIALADQMIRAGEVSAVVAGGMESMDQAPYLVPRARRGLRMGDGVLVDSMLYDGLLDAFTHRHMGDQSEDVNTEFSIERAPQDEWAARSHQRAERAGRGGLWSEEIVPLPVPQRRGDPLVFEHDEGIRPNVTPESLAALPPAFSPDGTITAGNASQISNGGAAVVVMSSERADELGIEPLAEVIAHGMSAAEPPYLHTVPALALQAALKKAGLAPGDLDLIEINEAFAAVAVHAAHMLLDGDEEIDARVNVNGGAVALGHPIGATGARLMVTLLHELRRRGGGLGAVTLCGGGGQGDALVVRVLHSA
jgi:acetyl-CoA C-acetyltransferase